MTVFKPRIVAVHLLNDFSGSPVVLQKVLESLSTGAYELHLFTSTPGRQGALTGGPFVRLHRLHYRRGSNPYLTLLFYIWSQLTLFIRLCFFLRRSDIVYINSLLPFGAAIAGYCRGCRVIYHLHEVSIRPELLKNGLIRIARKTGYKYIFVSDYLRRQLPVFRNGYVIHNVLSEAFLEKAQLDVPQIKKEFIVLMLCSLKKYKGVDHFVDLAANMPWIKFELVLNASWPEIRKYFQYYSIPANLTIYDAQANVHPFYRRASLVVNFSIPSEWVETFGMTILEAMAYRIPVIVPVRGGVTELVEHNVNGFCFESCHYRQLIVAIKLLSENVGCYRRMSRAAWLKSGDFRVSQFNSRINELVCSAIRMPDKKTGLTAAVNHEQFNQYK